MKQCKYCKYSARWDGLCLSCYQRSGLAEQRREEELVRQEREQAAQMAEKEAAALTRLLDLGDQQLPWWDISERLNRSGHRQRGAPWTPASARGVYVAHREDDWE